MSRFRPSIWNLMVVVGFCGVISAALVYPSALWASIIFTITFGLLLVSLTKTAFGPVQHRLFWGTITVFGWGYLLYILAMGEFKPPTPLAKFAIAELWGQLNPRGPFIPTIEPQGRESFSQIGQCLFTLLAALAGTLVVRFFASKEDATKRS